jgi:hypothetical protein
MEPFVIAVKCVHERPMFLDAFSPLDNTVVCYQGRTFKVNKNYPVVRQIFDELGNFTRMEQRVAVFPDRWDWMIEA